MPNDTKIAKNAFLLVQLKNFSWVGLSQRSTTEHSVDQVSHTPRYTLFRILSTPCSKAHYIFEQAGTGPSRRHIQGSKIAKGLRSVNLQYSKIKKATKMDRVARRSPLARAPGALKGGHFRNCKHFCRSSRGTLWRKNKFSKKVPQCRKTERGTLWDF